ncbi:MAG: hypothetical protein IT264_10310 [Saprospiraceae bacterium]|nr:hypothetical protein [Saprospiraceae bacterium]
MHSKFANSASLKPGLFSAIEIPKSLLNKSIILSLAPSGKSHSCATPNALATVPPQTVTLDIYAIQ